jgi:hypothetical protein
MASCPAASVKSNGSWYNNAQGVCSMDTVDILKYLRELNERLKTRDIKGQIGLFGGTVMCLAFNARSATKDIDAIFEPKQVIYDIARQMAQDYNLPADWLNDSVKGFVTPNREMKIFQNMSHLKVFIPSPEYMLAMKCMSLRLVGTKDEEDIRFLINYLKLENVDDILNIIQQYFPSNMIRPKTEYFLIELLEQGEAGDNNDHSRGR